MSVAATSGRFTSARSVDATRSFSSASGTSDGVVSFVVRPLVGLLPIGLILITAGCGLPS